MTSKERAALRSRANSLDVLFQIGKSGIGDTLIEQTKGALNTRELIKLRVLTDSSPVTPREAAEELSVATGADVIQVIGGVVVLYKYNSELHKKKSVYNKTSVKKSDSAKSKIRSYIKKSPFEDKKGRDKRLPKKDK